MIYYPFTIRSSCVNTKDKYTVIFPCPCNVRTNNAFAKVGAISHDVNDSKCFLVCVIMLSVPFPYNWVRGVILQASWQLLTCKTTSGYFDLISCLFYRLSPLRCLINSSWSVECLPFFDVGSNHTVNKAVYSILMWTKMSPAFKAVTYGFSFAVTNFKMTHTPTKQLMFNIIAPNLHRHLIFGTL